MTWQSLQTLFAKCTPIPLKSHVLQFAPATVEHFPILTPPAIAPPVVAPPVLPAFVSNPVVLVPAATLVPAAAPALIKERREPLASKQVIDPVVLGLEITEPLYVGAPHASRLMMEKEAAQKLEADLDRLYKSNAGRSRGWTKVGLEGLVKPRCASGGDLKDLQRAKKAFDWSNLSEDKALSAFLDFVCCARRIRCVVLDESKKIASLYPAADQIDEGQTNYPLYAVDIGGHIVHGITNLLEFVDSKGWLLQPPASVVHTLSGLKLDELESVGMKLGMTEVVGKKADRIAAVAAFKTRARLNGA